APAKGAMATAGLSFLTRYAAVNSGDKGRLRLCLRIAKSRLAACLFCISSMPVGTDWPHRRRPRRSFAHAVPGVVRRTRLVAASAPARSACKRAEGALGASDRADGRRQDPGGLSAGAGRPFCAAEAQARRAAARGPHAL